MKSVYFHNADRVFQFPNKTALKKFINDLFKREFNVLYELNYVFCSDEYLLQINKDHLQHDYYTDIITFDLSEERNKIIGEIYISLDRVRDNAQTLGTTLKEESLRVIFHGALHLCGFKDKTPAHQKIMRAKEDEYIALYNNHKSLQP
jgi:rRNA maturation RNase YbeY